jgi:predicted dehydrogenase
MDKIRFAIIGTGMITERFLKAAKNCTAFQLTAVYSRDLQKAEHFALEHGAEYGCSSLTDLARDKSIDAVYIASPNYMHFSQVLTMLQAGKHVLCEKALCSNSREASLLFHTARENHVVLLEAMRLLYDPGYELIRENIWKLGKLRRMQLNFCQYSSKYDAFKKGERQNIFDPACSAGALMDIGVYCVHFLIGLFGEPVSVKASSVMLQGEIDGAGTILAQYESMQAVLCYSKITASEANSEIQGEDGTMVFYPVAEPRICEIRYRDGHREVLEISGEENNMIYEIKRFLQGVSSGTDLNAYQEISRKAIKLMDEIRLQCEIHFPADDNL